MNRARAARSAVLLRELGADFVPGDDFDTDFDKRIACQKALYLTQALFESTFGHDLGYSFSWYVRGPYSRAAADDLYAIASGEYGSVRELTADVSLTPEGEGAIRRVATLAVPPSGLGMALPRWLELVASLHFIAHHPRPNVRDGDRFESAWHQLADAKPSLAERNEARTAWDALTECDLV